MNTDPRNLEKEAHTFLSEEKFEEAHRLFSEAGRLYKEQANHKEASLCFASAASCWSIKSGEKTFYNAAVSYEEAAREAEISGDYQYASLLYKYAAINYERDIVFIEFSDCLYRSRECYRKFVTYLLINPKKIHQISQSKEERGVKGFIKHVFLWFVLTFSWIVWGHGEKPSRTLSFGVLVIFISAGFYTLGEMLKNGIVYKLGFFEALYFSGITFATVGYGDITPLGFCKMIAMIEAFCAIFVIPLFITGLARKYLRV